MASTQTMSIDDGFTAIANAQFGDFTYTSGNGTVTITGYTGAGGNVVVPSTIASQPVTAIGANAFQGRSSITSLTIPSGVVSIGANAFYGCNNLSTATLPNTVTSIGDNAFYTCTRLTSISLPSSLTAVGTSVFQSCTALRSVSIAAGVTSIGTNAFYDCTSLTDISLPDGLTRLGPYAFGGCVSLRAVSLPSSLTEIGQAAFISCTSLSAIALPSTVTAIGVAVFQSCSSLAVVTIPPTLTAIGTNAFYGCSSLRSVTIPFSVKSIGGYAFGACSLLTSVCFKGLPPAVDATSFAGSPTTAYRSSIPRMANWHGLFIATDPLDTTYNGQRLYNSTQGVPFAPGPLPGPIPGAPSIGGSFFGPYENSLLYFPKRNGTSVAETGIDNSGQLVLRDAQTNEILGACYLESQYYRSYSGDRAGTELVLVIGTDAYFGQVTGTDASVDGGQSVFLRRVTDYLGNGSTPALTRFVATGDVGLSVGVNRIQKEGSGIATLTTGSSHTGGTVVEAGELVVQHNHSLGSGHLEVQYGAKVTLRTGSATVAVNSLALADTARLELGTGKLTVAANGFTESDIRRNLITGRNGGSWDGPSGITSTFAGGDRSIGYRVADGALEVAYAAPGDSNLDGVIDILDIADIISAGKFNTGAAANWRQGDVNYDNVFDIVDLADILGTNLFNQGTYLTQGSATSSAVETGGVATFDSALVFAALAMDSSSQPTTKRKSF